MSLHHCSQGSGPRSFGIVLLPADGCNSIFHRLFCSLPKSLQCSSGRSVGRTRSADRYIRHFFSASQSSVVLIHRWKLATKHVSDWSIQAALPIPLPIVDRHSAYHFSSIEGRRRFALRETLVVVPAIRVWNSSCIPAMRLPRIALTYQHHLFDRNHR